MKIAVINFSGNVGKTTLAHHLLAPCTPGSEYIAARASTPTKARTSRSEDDIWAVAGIPPGCRERRDRH